MYVSKTYEVGAPILTSPMQTTSTLIVEQSNENCMRENTCKVKKCQKMAYFTLFHGYLMVKLSENYTISVPMLALQIATISALNMKQSNQNCMRENMRKVKKCQKISYFTLFHGYPMVQLSDNYTIGVPMLTLQIETTSALSVKQSNENCMRENTCKVKKCQKMTYFTLFHGYPMVQLSEYYTINILMLPLPVPTTSALIVKQSDKDCMR
jgi:hypothetical protein